MHTKMKRILVAVFAAMAVLALSGAVTAAKPNNQACVGHDISGYAQGGSAFGGFISGLARNGPGGFGTEIQLHMAGLIPDSVIPNSCNDP